MTGGADLVLFGGAVWTGVAGHVAEAVAVVDGRIVAVGRDEDVRDAVGPAAEAVNLRGRAVVPGFQDAHCHPVSGGLQARRCDLGDARTVEECQAAVAAFVERSPGAGWITGGGWSMETFPGGTPAAELLDGVSGGRPAFLVNRDGHGAWVNRRALEMAGIDSSTPDPAHGRIERDERGLPQGTLQEGAMDLVGRLVPPPSADELAAALTSAQAHLLRLGVTGWQDAAVDADVESAYARLATQGAVRSRTRLALWWDRDRGLDQISELVARRERLAALGLDAGSVKIMLDGVIENHTAAMLEPYRAPTGHAPGGCRHELGSGRLFVEPEVVTEAVARLSAEGFQVHFHAIGDRAVRLALDAVEAANSDDAGQERASRKGPAGRLRHHVAHIQVVHPDDVRRFQRLGVVANAQPFWACVEPQMTELTLPFLGEPRSGWQYPFASLAATGARLAGGSDWPVSTADPLEEIAVAVARVLPESARAGAPAEEPFIPHERLALEAAFEAFTSGSAYVNHLEAETGTVEPGKLADLVVLAADPFGLPADRLPEARVCCTIVGGEVAYESGEV